jgi:hypothetical protein
MRVAVRKTSGPRCKGVRRGLLVVGAWLIARLNRGAGQGVVPSLELATA